MPVFVDGRAVRQIALHGRRKLMLVLDVVECERRRCCRGAVENVLRGRVRARRRRLERDGRREDGAERERDDAGTDDFLVHDFSIRPKSESLLTGATSRALFYERSMSFAERVLVSARV